MLLTFGHGRVSHDVVGPRDVEGFVLVFLVHRESRS